MFYTVNSAIFWHDFSRHLFYIRFIFGETLNGPSVLTLKKHRKTYPNYCRNILRKTEKIERNTN